MKRVIQKGDLGEAVKDLAAVRGISISALERAVGYSPGMISRWIAAGPEDYNSLSRLVAMADLLEVSLDELIGRRSMPQGGANGIASRLEAETRTEQLSWSAWQPGSTLVPKDSMPVHESGRLCCGGWWAQRDSLKFVLALFCDDIDDEDEPMELGLYCTPGHNFPLFSVPDVSSDTLPTLYAQILMVNAFAMDRRGITHAVWDLDAQGGKTVPFRVLNS